MLCFFCLDRMVFNKKHLVLKKGCLNKHKIARLEEFHGHILATEEIKQAFEAARVTGLRFVTPEDYYAAILTALNLFRLCGGKGNVNLETAQHPLCPRESRKAYLWKDQSLSLLRYSQDPH